MENSVIPCLDLRQQHENLREELFKAWEKVYAQCAFSGGPFVADLENAFASFCGVPYAAGVSNGTTALHLAMMAAGISQGDEVIVPANTFIATVWGVSYVGATPVFVDCDPFTWEIDPSKVEAAITENTKAIIGVHLYGQPCDLAKLGEICRKNGLLLIEDASQAQGATYHGARVGGFGDLATFSFYPGKNLGACGEAGAVTTRSEHHYERILRMRNHGSSVRYHHEELGFNYRMGGLEAASLLVKLRHLERWNDRRRQIAERYVKEFLNPRIRMQHQPEGLESVYHLFVVTVDDRDAFVAHLAEKGITAAFHYPVPCHLQKAYSHLGHVPGDFPNAEYLASHCVSLPMFPELSDMQVGRVINAVNSFS